MLRKIIDRRKLERSLVRPTNLQDGPENVGTKQPEDVEILERLQVLGVALLREWDVLAFLYCHPASLCAVPRGVLQMLQEQQTPGAILSQAHQFY